LQPTPVRLPIFLARSSFNRSTVLLTLFSLLSDCGNPSYPSGTLASDYGKQFSVLVIGMIPMVVFYLVFRKQITKGVAAGAVKG
jgi:ABC-type glycerol-3-phosphate transport system permease component